MQIPAGVATGQYMTLRGVGNAGPRGAPRGDVHVVFEVADDPRFERDGEDLYTEVLVTYPQLVLGAELERPGGLGAHRRCACRRHAERSRLPPARPWLAARERAAATATCTCACSSGRRSVSPTKSASSSRASARFSPACPPTVAARASGRR